LDNTGSAGSTAASPTPHGGNTAALRHMSKKGCVFEWWYQTCHILVSNHAIFFSSPWALTFVNRSDLNSSVMTGSSRVVDHTTFSELQWKRDPFVQDSFTLPPGFQAYSHLLGQDFVEVLKDVFALQCIRDSTFFGEEDIISMSHIDNHQASIQSRLVNLPNCCSISECCHLAAYLCSTMLRCKLWRTSTIPVSQIMEHFLAYRSLLPSCADFGWHSPTFHCSYWTSYEK
jgi:hypothetical protein